MDVYWIGIDYGPFGMMEYYQTDYVPNYSDDEGRYAYNKQVEISKWNIITLANALDKVGILSLNISSKYYGKYLSNLYETYYLNEMKKKFGLMYNENKKRLKLLVDVFLGALSDSVCDMTNVFRHLNMISIYGIGQCKVYDENKREECEELEDKLFIEYVIKQCVTPSHYYTLQKRKYMIKTQITNDKSGGDCYDG